MTRYFNNTSVSGLPAAQLCTTTPGGYFTDAPAAGVRADNFSVDNTATFFLPSTSSYALSVNPENAGVRVWLDNVLVVNRWQAGSWGTTQVPRALTAGPHTVRVAYFGTTGLTGLDMSLYRASYGPANTNGNYFAANSFWNTPLPAAPAVDPRSASWIAQLDKAVTGVSLNSNAWSVPIYTAPAGTPMRSILITNTGRRVSVPYLAGYRPSPDPTDKHLAIIDSRTNCLYEFQTFDPSSMQAIAQATYRVDRGSGGHVGGPGHAGGELSYLGGLITPQDVNAKVIDHALRYALPPTINAPTAVYPATRSDGETTGGVPEGTRIQLDPSLDLTSYHLSPFQRMVAVALQKYGGYDADNGGAFAVYARSTIDGTSYSQSLSGLPDSLVKHMRFLAASTISTSIQLDDASNAMCSQQH